MRLHFISTLLIAGCGDPVPEQVEYDDVARLVGATIATSDGGATLGAVNDSILLAFGGMPAGFTYENGMAYGDHGALAHQYLMIQCRDREGRLLKPCNQLTNMATLIAAWSGSLDQPEIDLRSNRQGMWTLANLQTWVPTITGSSTLQSEGTVSGRAYELTATETESMVAPTAMMGGTIHFELAITRVAAEPIDTTMAADIVFDAAMRSASLTLDGEYPYRVDLATGIVEQ